MKISRPSPRRMVAPDLDEARQAKQAARLIASMSSGKEGSHLLQFIPENKVAQSVAIPESAFRLFLEILNQMSQGNAVTLVPTHHELTTQEAADLLRVSRPYFVKLLEQDAIQHHRVGSRRRVKFEHLMNYMEKVKGESQEALGQLAAEAQALNMGY